MSDSYRKTPIFGHTTAESDKRFKTQEHRRERRSVRALIRAGGDAPDSREFGNPWASEKDGKTYWLGAPPEAMRK